ncbi:BTB domain-containing protein [Mycena venus]|uniref:BTB domain-containing protein n=1 Tax=Mycena venus TaxID=2733690 RepID=A0A8H6YR90_9AGAR|nr:BTB domain-containing protein [Mycena venus]
MSDTNPATVTDGLQSLVNDDKYFFDDGDCMFIVGGFLFKLHRLFLSRDPESVFRDMFRIPQGSTTAGNELDPIPLTEDSADDFRALCWALYALPGEIQLQNDSEANIERQWQ